MGVNDVRPKGRNSDTKEAIERYKKELTLYRRVYQSARTADERPDTGKIDDLYKVLRELGFSEREIKPITDKVREAVEHERE